MPNPPTHPNGVSQIRANISGGSYRSAFYGSTPAGNDTHVQRAIVREIIPNIHEITEEHRERLIEDGLSEDMLSHLPRNTVFVQLVQGTVIGTSYIPAFPFFSSHLSLPLKPGEYVWVFFEDPTNKDLGFWMSRVHETEFVEDVNYTHGDRKFSADGNIDLTRPKDEKEKVVGFPNGQDKETLYTIDDPDAFKKIHKESLGSEYVASEPVPRLTKRPGDFVLQGSNNAAIILGEDRTGSVKRPDTLKNQAGTIDAVVGRGTKYAKDTTPEQPSAPHVVKTTRGYLEVDKTGDSRPNEGDPDFVHDSARLYLSMKTNGDDNFGVVYPSNEVDGNKEPKKESSYVIHKANEIRVIARESGSVHIIKEGENPASIILHANGNVQIDAEKIQLGRDVGADKGFVKYSKYKEQMDELLTFLNAAFTKMSTAMSSNASPGYGSPNPGVTIAGTHANTAAVDAANLKGKIQTARSEKILGE